MAIEKRFWPNALSQFRTPVGLKITRLALGQPQVTGRIIAVHEDSIVVDWPGDSVPEDF